MPPNSSWATAGLPWLAAAGRATSTVPSHPSPKSSCKATSRQTIGGGGACGAGSAGGASGGASGGSGGSDGDGSSHGGAPLAATMKLAVRRRRGASDSSVAVQLVVELVSVALRPVRSSTAVGSCGESGLCRVNLTSPLAVAASQSAPSAGNATRHGCTGTGACALN